MATSKCFQWENLKYENQIKQSIREKKRRRDIHSDSSFISHFKINTDHSSDQHSGWALTRNIYRYRYMPNKQLRDLII
jgi:hypothetical protein